MHFYKYTHTVSYTFTNSLTGQDDKLAVSLVQPQIVQLSRGRIPGMTVWYMHTCKPTYLCHIACSEVRDDDLLFTAEDFQGRGLAVLYLQTMLSY